MYYETISDWRQSEAPLSVDERGSVVKTAFSFANLDNLQSRALSLKVFYPRSLAAMAF